MSEAKNGEGQNRTADTTIFRDSSPGAPPDG